MASEKEFKVNDNIPRVTRDKLLEKCKEYGWYCDCEILMNAAPMLLGEETPW